MKIVLDVSAAFSVITGVAGAEVLVQYLKSAEQI